MKENCTECKHHDVFWGGSGCNLLNNGERCKFEPKVMTNADRIRAMTDEELEKFIQTIKTRAVLCKAAKNNDAFNELCSIEWLKQSVE